jgi:type II secretory ATPase GspE/PulE/Tfp pilus assembly ATPase PilB-like protein
MLLPGGYPMSHQPEELDLLSTELRFEKKLLTLVNAIHAATDTNSIMLGVRDQILDVYQVEMATIFLVDARKRQLVSWLLLPGEFLQKICLPINTKSITGYVAATQETINIHDVYDTDELQDIDPSLKFSASWDQKAQVRTKQILAAPITSKNSLMGVLELINKKGDTPFTRKDQEHIHKLTETLAIAFYNHSRQSKKTPLKYESLIQQNLISRKELDRALAIAAQQKKDPESILIDNFRIPKLQIGNLLAEFYDTRYVNLEELSYNPRKLFKGINIDYFKTAQLVPLSIDDGKLIIAAKDPEGQTASIQEVKQVLRADSVETVLAFQSDINTFWDRIKTTYYNDGKEQGGQVQSFDKIIELIEVTEKQIITEKPETKGIDDRPVVLLVDKIIENAYYANASDIHIEPYGLDQKAEVRYRIDGSCHNVLEIPKHHVKQVVARLKIMADLNIAERRRPQDGKIRFNTSKGKDIELRVATIPTANSNEDIVLRVLADSKPLPLKEILPARLHTPFMELVEIPFGIILVVGPTGSGKTTTLHSALSHINTPERKIWTAEDPVEITQYRLRQVQVHPAIGFTFASAMRAFLRADPDVIMIGEMRDQETAKMAIEASLTGHLVLSTLHTNSAPETIVRLLDMGIDTFNFADALLGVLAQRLVRTLCENCKEAYHPEKAEYDHLLRNYGVSFFDNINIAYSDDLRLHRTKGCPECNNTGYKGRMGLYELMVATHTIKKLIIERATVSDIKEEAISNGMTVLLQEGIQLIFAGKTDFKQVMSVCSQ